MWDLVAGVPQYEIPEGAEFTWSPDGTRFLVGNRVYDPSGQGVTSLEDPEHPGFWNVAWSGDGTRVAMALEGDAAGVAIWDVERGEIIRTLDTGSGTDWIALESDRRRLLTGGERPTIWDPDSGEAIAELEGRPDVCDADFSPDSRLLAIGGGDFTVRLFDPATGRQLLVLRGHERIVCSVEFSADGSMLVSQSPGEIRVWALDMNDLLEIARRNVTR